MTTYTPDRWLIVKWNVEDPYYFVMCSWYGGFMDSDSWRRSAPIVSVTEDREYWYFITLNSTYACNKPSYGASIEAATVLARQMELNLGVGEIQFYNHDFNTILQDNK